MDALWLAVCGDEVQAERCRAAVRRSGGGRVLWVGDGPAAERLASCAADAGEKPRLVACDTLDGLDALAVAARRQGINLVVLADAADPSRTMGLFQRGVQEVIADSATGDDWVPARVESAPPPRRMPREAVEIRAEEDETGLRSDGAGWEADAGGDGGSRAHVQVDGDGPSPARDLGDGPWRQPEMQRYVVDLDEPDIAEVWPAPPPLEDISRGADADAEGAPCHADGAGDGAETQRPGSPVVSAGGSGFREGPSPSVAREAGEAAVSPGPSVSWPRARGGGETSPASGAPVIVAVSGVGGCGKSTIIAAMALMAAQGGLRCAVLDLDLMFGRLYIKLGVQTAHDLACLVEPAAQGVLGEDDVVRASTRVAPGLTLWGPVDLPEQAELLGPAVERLLEVLRRESDVVLVDTSTFWGDAVAAAVAVCDRCLVVADGRPGAAAASARLIDLALAPGRAAHADDGRVQPLRRSRRRGGRGDAVRVHRLAERAGARRRRRAGCGRDGRDRKARRALPRVGGVRRLDALDDGAFDDGAGGVLWKLRRRAPIPPGARAGSTGSGCLGSVRRGSDERS